MGIQELGEDQGWSLFLAQNKVNHEERKLDGHSPGSGIR